MDPASEVDEQGRLRLRYLGPRDEPWLTALLDQYAQHFGCRRAVLRERLRQPLSVRAPKHPLRLATRILETSVPDLELAAQSPRDVRERVFRTAAPRLVPRAEVLRQVAKELGSDAAQIEAALLSDLAGERCLGRVPAELSARQLALLVNRTQVGRLLQRATSVCLTAWGRPWALVRRARALGLICTATAASEAFSVRLEICGPFALFRRTQRYGRALSSLLANAAACDAFELEAHCVLTRGAAPATFVVYGSDPIFPHERPVRSSRPVETRFARAFGRATRDWTLRCEPTPIPSGASLLCPDFELMHHAGEAPYYLEVLGFWTPKSLHDRLRQYEAAGAKRVILCVDARRGCGEVEPPARARVVYYSNRIDPAQVLAALKTEP